MDDNARSYPPKGWSGVLLATNARVSMMAKFENGTRMAVCFACESRQTKAVEPTVMKTKHTSPFRPVELDFPDERDEFTYEPAKDLAAAFKALAEANVKCRSEATFVEVAESCRRCRTAFAEFISEALTAGPSVRVSLLPRLQELLTETQDVVTKALPGLSDAEERRLAKGYLRHIGERIRLADALQRRALPGYLDEIVKALSKPVPASPVLA